MSITEQENELFERWKPNRDGFISDGIADEKEYLNSTKKILFIMKEVNDPGGGGWDFRAFMRNGARSKTWDNITRWIEGIRNISDDIEWKKLSNISENRRIFSIKSVAAINIKKSPGGHTTDSVMLAKIAIEDKLFFSEQFNLYMPDYIISCGTDVTNFIAENIEIIKQAKWLYTSRGIRYKEYSENRYIIGYVHPEARVPDSLIYYGLIDAIREIENMKLRK